MVETPEEYDILNDVDTLFGPKVSSAKNAKLYSCQKYTGEKLKGIGRNFGIGESGCPRRAGVFLEESVSTQS